MQNGVAAVGNNMKVPQKNDIKLLYDPKISLLGIYSKEFKSRPPSNISIHMFTAELFTIVMMWKQLNVHGQVNIDKEDVVYIHSGILCNLKKEENSTIYDNLKDP